MSATASPNYTLREEQLKELDISKPLLLLDLAVPRDIEPSVGKIDGIKLYDMDSFRSKTFSPEQKESLDKAARIVQDQMDEFFQWLNGRDLIPRIQEIRRTLCRT